MKTKTEKLAVCIISALPYDSIEKCLGLNNLIRCLTVNVVDERNCAVELTELWD